MREQETNATTPAHAGSHPRFTKEALALMARGAVVKRNALDAVSHAMISR